MSELAKPCLLTTGAKYEPHQLQTIVLPRLAPQAVRPPLGGKSMQVSDGLRDALALAGKDLPSLRKALVAPQTGVVSVPSAAFYGVISPSSRIFLAKQLVINSVLVSVSGVPGAFAESEQYTLASEETGSIIRGPIAFPSAPPPVAPSQAMEAEGLIDMTPSRRLSREERELLMEEEELKRQEEQLKVEEAALAANSNDIGLPSLDLPPPLPDGPPPFDLPPPPEENPPDHPTFYIPPVSAPFPVSPPTAIPLLEMPQNRYSGNSSGSSPLPTSDRSRTNSPGGSIITAKDGLRSSGSNNGGSVLNRTSNTGGASSSVTPPKDKKEAKKLEKKQKKEKKDKEKEKDKDKPLMISAPLPFPNPPRELTSSTAVLATKLVRMVEVHWPKDLTGLEDYSKKFLPDSSDTVGKLLQRALTAQAVLPEAAAKLQHSEWGLYCPRFESWLDDARTLSSIDLRDRDAIYLRKKPATGDELVTASDPAAAVREMELQYKKQAEDLLQRLNEEKKRDEEERRRKSAEEQLARTKAFEDSQRRDAQEEAHDCEAAAVPVPAPATTHIDEIKQKADEGAARRRAWDEVKAQEEKKKNEELQLLMAFDEDRRLRKETDQRKKLEEARSSDEARIKQQEFKRKLELEAAARAEEERRLQEQATELEQRKQRMAEERKKAEEARRLAEAEERERRQAQLDEQRQQEEERRQRELAQRREAEAKRVAEEMRRADELRQRNEEALKMAEIAATSPPALVARPGLLDRQRTGTGGPGNLVKPMNPMAATDLVSRYFPGRSASPGTATAISALPKRLNEVNTSSWTSGGGEPSAGPGSAAQAPVIVPPRSALSPLGRGMTGRGSTSGTEAPKLELAPVAPKPSAPSTASRRDTGGSVSPYMTPAVKPVTPPSTSPQRQPIGDAARPNSPPVHAPPGPSPLSGSSIYVESSAMPIASPNREIGSGGSPGTLAGIPPVRNTPPTSPVPAPPGAVSKTPVVRNLTPTTGRASTPGTPVGTPPVRAQIIPLRDSSPKTQGSPPLSVTTKPDTPPNETSPFPMSPAGFAVASMKTRPPASIEELLTKLDMASFIPVFKHEEIDLQTAMLLSEDQLGELGLPIGRRLRLLAAFKTMQPQDEHARLREIEEAERRLAAEKQRILEVTKAKARYEGADM